jgi:hypothetical protein
MNDLIVLNTVFKLMKFFFYINFVTRPPRAREVVDGTVVSPNAWRLRNAIRVAFERGVPPTVMELMKYVVYIELLAKHRIIIYSEVSDAFLLFTYETNNLHRNFD